MRSVAVACLILMSVSAAALVPADLLEQRTCGIGALSPDGRLLVYTVGDFSALTGT